MGLLKTWEMLYSDFPEAKVIIPRTRKIIFNSCDQNILSDYALDDGRNVDEQVDFFSKFIFKKKNLNS